MWFRFTNNTPFSIKASLWYVVLTLAAFSLPAAAEKYVFTVALHQAGGHEYFPELIETAMMRQGHQVEIRNLGKLPQKRIIALFEEGQISLVWLVRSQQRDQNFTVIDFPLTGGLIGRRILLIPPDQQHVYDSVDSLDAFRRLKKTAAMGKGWFDAKVWAANKLLYRERDGDWRAKVYAQVAVKNRGVDYFPRGAMEILEEAQAHPELAIERNLVLQYERDFVFYLAKDAVHLKAPLEDALNAADSAGIVAQLTRKYWPAVYSQLALEKRIVIPLVTPQ